MPSSYTASARFTLQATGENNNTWGVILNSGVFQLVDTAIAGRLSFTLSGSRTLTSVNGATDEARNAILDVTGGTGGTVTIPSVSKIYFGRNAASASVIFSTGGIVTATLGPGDVLPFWSDGSAVYPMRIAGYTIQDYIAAVAWASVGTLPAQLGNAGKFIRTDGTNATWQFVAATDITSFSATATVTRVGTSTTAALTPGDTYAALAEVALTSTANSVAIDFSTLINGYHLFTENTTFANPTNAKPGQTGYIRVQQHASSAKTGAMGSNWKRAGGAVPFSTTLSGFDFIVFEVITASYILYDIVKNPS